jgi:magnesium transporter
MDPPQSSPRDQPPKPFLNDQEYIDDESVDHDIYRGDNRGDSRPTLRTSESGSAAVAVSQGSSSNVSSGSFRLAGGRLGVLATRLERAITRWARNNWADSSSSVTSSTSSESSRSSFRTANKSSRRKRRPPNLADILQREKSERAVAARIRAREIGRAVPREFNLYVPPPSPSQDAWPPINQEQRVLRTFSLDVVLPHLDPLLRRPGKHRRPQQRSRSTRTEPDQSGHPRHRHPHRDHSARDEACNASRTNALDGPSLIAGKGKDKIRSTTPSPNPLPTSSMFAKDLVVEKAPQAWWLDIASPSWEDMKTLGKVSGPPTSLNG